jgi:hypothetical protein
MASQLANTMWNSLKGRPILVLHFVLNVPTIFIHKRRLLVIENYFVGSYLSREGATTICCSFPAHGYLEGTHGQTQFVASLFYVSFSNGCMLQTLCVALSNIYGQFVSGIPINYVGWNWIWI